MGSIFLRFSLNTNTFKSSLSHENHFYALHLGKTYFDGALRSQKSLNSLQIFLDFLSAFFIRLLYVTHAAAFKKNIVPIQTFAEITEIFNDPGTSI